MKIRIKFSKNGPIKFIGHLDVMRYFQKAIRRAEIDVAYSQGFSPHQIMSFAQPLGVGVESNGEYVDIELNSLISTLDIKERLNTVMNEGIHIESVKQLPENAMNAMASVKASLYEIRIKEGYNLGTDFFAKCENLANEEEILIIKKTKKNELKIDIKPAIFKLSIQSNVLVIMLDSSSSGNVKPNLFLEAVCNHNGLEYNPMAFSIRRMDMYTEIDNELVSMDTIGEEFL